MESLIDQAHVLKLAESDEWLKLGYYHRNLLGMRTSRGSASFFLAMNGQDHPKAELDATIRNLFITQERAYPGVLGGESQVPRCQFPARYRWIIKKLSVRASSLPVIHCEHLEKFRTRMGGQSASVVFSSFFLNSPSSSFGHSLLRISRLPGGSPTNERLELLDYGVGYAADANTSNPVVYAFNGIFGLFRGTYSNIPYYYKVREYNDFESRDLWSYELNLTDEESATLVDRIWEIGSTTHAYYYFTFNCSNAILQALEVAAPRFRIMERLKFYVIPSDTIKTLMEVPGLVKRVTYRPSAYSLFRQRIAAMDGVRKNAFNHLMVSNYDPSSLSQLDPSSAVDVLDAGIDYLDFKFPKEVTQRNSPAANFRQNLLLARAAHPIRSRSFLDEAPEAARPDRGHPSGKFGLQYGRERFAGNYSQLNLRFALHDALDPPEGYPEYSQIEMIGLKIRYLNERRRLELEDFNFFRLLSLAPLSEYNHSHSWRGELGGKRIRDVNCNRCVATTAEFGSGYAFHIGSHAIVYTMGEFFGAYSPSFAGPRAHIGVGPDTGLLLNYGKFGSLTDAHYAYQLFGASHNSYELSTELRYNPSSAWSIGIEAQGYTTRDYELSAKTAFFF